ncbi:MAG TPA: DUF58 domain-containing protein [Clostridiales bacterium]|nr:DUF58 domain-containing protein [Clostridiales bacterium]
MKTFDQDFLKKLEQLALIGTKPVQGSTGGNRRSKARGSDIEFSDFREYTLGDDYRSIDWNAYARFERLFIKLYMEEREANITIFLDTSASMDYGNPNKGILAKKLAAIFAYIALANYDRVGIAALNEKISGQLPYFSGKPGFIRALEFLDRLPFNGRTSLSRSITSFSPLRGRKGISIILSDFLAEDGYMEAFKYLKYQQQDVIAVQILSPEELDPQLSGALRLIDTETGESVEVEITHNTLNMYKKELHAFMDKIKNTCSNLEIPFLQVSSDISIEQLVFEKLQHSGMIV